MNLQNKIIAALVGFIVFAGAILGFGHHQYQKGYSVRATEYQVQIDKLKLEADATLTAETAKVHAAEQALQDFKNTQEMKDADHQKTVADLSDRIRRSAGQSGRLRDPNATGCGKGDRGAESQESTPTSGGADDDSETGRLFSAGATELLQRLTREADEINIAYASCRADAFAIRDQNK